MAKLNDTQGTTLSILELRTGALELHILGLSPLIYNAMSEKARHDLLMPRGRMSGIEKQSNLKHDPVSEYRSSVYAYPDNDHPTRLMFPAAAFKKAAMNAALRIPGAKKTEIGQLLWVNGLYLDMFGIPQLKMDVTRSADINHTPDIRTRAILSTWACKLSITYVLPQITPNVVGNLFAAAGLIIGVGDYRQEKGAGNFGQFKIVDENEAAYKSIVKLGVRAAQERALAEPATYDLESEKLLEWYHDEFARREQGKRIGKSINGTKEAMNNEA